MLGFRFSLYMSLCFGGNWNALTLCIGSQVTMWSCRGVVFRVSGPWDCPVCIPLPANHSNTDCCQCWCCAGTFIHCCVYEKETLLPAWGMFLHHNAKFELSDLAGCARHLRKLLNSWDGLEEQRAHVLIEDFDVSSGLWGDFIQRPLRDMELAERSHWARVLGNGSMSRWGLVTSDTPQGLVLGLVLFNISAGDMETGIEYTLSICTNDTGLCDVLEGRNTTQGRPWQP